MTESQTDTLETPAGTQDPSSLEVLAILLKRWRTVVGVPAALVTITVGIALVLPFEYRAHTSFVTETSSDVSALPGGLAGIASQMGLALPSGSQLPDRFYVDLIGTITIRNTVLQHAFSDPWTAGATKPLVDLLEITGNTETDRLEKGRRRLSQLVSQNYNPQTGLISLAVDMRSPVLAADVANYFIELVGQFNLQTRQTRARVSREFMQDRVESARRELDSSEAVLEQFLIQNRQFEGSPTLQFEHDRLQRQVRMKEQVLTTLLMQFEEARIQEVNDTPVLTIVDVALPPYDKARPRRRLMVMVAGVAGVILGMFGALIREYLETTALNNRKDYEELTGRWHSFKRDALRLGGRQ